MTMHRCTLALAGSMLLACSSASTGESVVTLDASFDANIDAGVHDAAPARVCDMPDSGLPQDVFCIGLYAGDSPGQHASDVMAYTPGLKFWSDGAQKDRFLHLPAGSKIDTSNLDDWKFPVGTKAWKEFRVDGKLVETRIYWKRSDVKWEWGTYIWNADATAASLNMDGKPILLASGYEIPTQRDCGKCHEGGADQLIGVEAISLALEGAQGVTLKSLAEAGQLSHPPSRLTATLPEDSTGKAAAGLGYLHVNCGAPCHSTRGLGDETLLVMRLRADEIWTPDGAGPVAVEQTDLYKATVNQVPTTASVAQHFPGAHRIVPGAHDQSLVYQLSHLRGNYQMPPLVSHQIDEQGTAALAAWIDALPVKP